MITREVLEEMINDARENGLSFAIDGFLDEELSSGDYGYYLGRFAGRQEILEELLVLLDNANTIRSDV